MLRELPGGLPSDLLASALYDAPTWFADAMAELARRVSIGDLTDYGLPKPSEGVFSRGIRLGRAPAIVDKAVIKAFRAGLIEVVPTIARLDGERVWLVDGRPLMPDTVICATGYRPGLVPLVGHLGVLDGDGLPIAAGATAAEAGLRFVGFLSRPALIAFVAKESHRVAQRIVDELEPTPTLHW
jgi:hypothetical protein